jgi:hypothetical protein
MRTIGAVVRECESCCCYCFEERDRRDLALVVVLADLSLAFSAGSRGLVLSCCSSRGSASSTHRASTQKKKILSLAAA